MVLQGGFCRVWPEKVPSQSVCRPTAVDMGQTLSLLGVRLRCAGMEWPCKYSASSPGGPGLCRPAKCGSQSKLHPQWEGEWWAALVRLPSGSLGHVILQVWLWCHSMDVISHCDITTVISQLWYSPRYHVMYGYGSPWYHSFVCDIIVMYVISYIK